jgi:hypothetical protein
VEREWSIVQFRVSSVGGSCPCVYFPVSREGRLGRLGRSVKREKDSKSSGERVQDGEREGDQWCGLILVAQCANELFALGNFEIFNHITTVYTINGESIFEWLIEKLPQLSSCPR